MKPWSRAAVRLWVVTALALAACKPWTTRPIDGRAGKGQGKTETSDVASYVQSIWPDQVVQEARKAAITLTPGAIAALPRSAAGVFVQGTGTVADVDARSRVGLALVDLAPRDGRPDVAVQIGPVLTGTALRDALPFVRFDDFANQVDYAAVSSSLHEQVLSSVLARVDPASLRGSTISFIGATAPARAASGRLPDVVPVLLERAAR